MTPFKGERPRVATRIQATKGPRDWYRIENATSEHVTILLYDEISIYGVTAQDFVRELRELSASKIELRIHSPGGDVFDAFAIYNALREHKATVEVHVDSLAASAASVIAMAGDRVIMHKPSEMMIHDAWGVAFGNAGEFREFAELLDKFSDQIAQVYADRAGGSVREWRDRMLEETWLDQQEAVDLGLADEVSGVPSKTPKNTFDLSVFARVPDHLATAASQRAPHEPTKRKAEAILRDAGWSKAEALAVLSASRPEPDLRDAEGDRILATLRALTAV